MAKWDWYQTTMALDEGSVQRIVKRVLDAWPGSIYRPTANRNGYTHGASVLQGEGKGAQERLKLLWGGNPGVNLAATSESAPVLSQALTELGYEHWPTRVDACEDWDSPGLFDNLSARLIEFAESRRISICQVGDWVRGKSRILYVGSKSSPVRLVLYEKGHEQRDKGVNPTASLDWVRLEVRVRPKDRDRASVVAAWSPGQAFGAGWVPKALESIGWDHLEQYKVGTVWRMSDSDRARRAMVRQYHRVIAEWAAELGGVEKLGAAMVSEIENMLDDKQKKPGNTAQPEAAMANCLQ